MLPPFLDLVYALVGANGTKFVIFGAPCTFMLLVPRRELASRSAFDRSLNRLELHARSDIPALSGVVLHDVFVVIGYPGRGIVEGVKLAVYNAILFVILKLEIYPGKNSAPAGVAPIEGSLAVPAAELVTPVWVSFRTPLIKVRTVVPDLLIAT